MAKKKSAANKKSPRFEESLAGLEQIVSELESGDLPLTDAIRRYEEGVKLLGQCHQTLGQFQKKIELLTQVDEQGQETTVPFDSEGTPANQPARGKPASEEPKKRPSESVENDPDVDEAGRLF